LDWLNALLKLRLSKVEDTCNGAVAAQVVDSLFPGVVMMNKLNWGAKSDYEYVANYKVLQAAFTQLKIDRQVDVTKLIQGKVQDNLEFMQWLKKFAANNPCDVPYDPIARRNLGKNVPPSMGGGRGRPQPVTKSAAPARTTPAAPVANIKENVDASATLKAAENVALQARLQECKSVEKELRQQLLTAEKERDFYFAKLRDVELLIENVTSETAANLVESLTGVLFAAEEEEDGEFVDTE
jgi:RP/EB family microtubule-associated protein